MQTTIGQLVYVRDDDDAGLIFLGFYTTREDAERESASYMERNADAFTQPYSAVFIVPATMGQVG